jgi:hypothetical protein
MGTRDRERSAGIDPVYEGDDVLSALLARAGSALGAGEVAARFAGAQARGEGRALAIPALFPGEPRFASPDDARRLYANLFGLWEKVRGGAAAAGAGDGAAAAGLAGSAPEVPPLPPRGAEPGPQISAAVVEAVWQHLDALSPRERRRQRDRYEAAQPDLAAWVESLPLADVAAVAAQDLAHELWSMLDRAFGDRLATARFAELRAFEQEPPPLATTQPALAAYVDEVLDLVDEEDAGFGEGHRAAVERAMAAAVAALTGAGSR